MNCFICQDSATLACPRCGRSVCNKHQARHAQYDAQKYICKSCFQEVEEKVAAQKLLEKQWQEQETKRKAEEARASEENHRRWEEEERKRRQEEEERKRRWEHDSEAQRARKEALKCRACNGTGRALLPIFKRAWCNGDGTNHHNYPPDENPGGNCY